MVRYGIVELVYKNRLVLGLIVVLLLFAACVPITAPTSVPQEGTVAESPTSVPEVEALTPTLEPEAEALTPTPEPETEALTPTSAPEAEATPPADSAPPTTVDLDAIFPAGSEYERNLVLFSCGSCHAWVCAVINQRPVEHWRTTQATHRDLVSTLSDEDFTKLFDFLSQNFNDTQPEPPLPPALRALGCTTQ